MLHFLLLAEKQKKSKTSQLFINFYSLFQGFFFLCIDGEEKTKKNKEKNLERMFFLDMNCTSTNVCQNKEVRKNDKSLKNATFFFLFYI